MVARIYTTVRFWHQRVKTPHVLAFFKLAISSRDDEKFAKPFFHLAAARYVSLGHVVAIDPLIDSIPEPSIDCWASAVIHLTGAIFLRWFQQRFFLLGSCNSTPHSHLPSPFTTHVDHGLHHQALLAVFSGDRLPTLTSICVNNSSASVHGRYHPTPPHPTYTFHVRWARRAASVQEHSISVASHSSASVHGRYHPTPPHPNHILSMCGEHVELPACKNIPSA